MENVSSEQESNPGAHQYEAGVLTHCDISVHDNSAARIDQRDA
jgi:hypothetical protein